MNAKDFNEIVYNRMDWCEQILLVKGEEYSREGDRLWNFKSAGRKRNKHPAEALLDMKVKHDVSVDDIVDDLKRGVIQPKEFIAEKIGDSIDYLLLLEGLIEEARQESKEYNACQSEEIFGGYVRCPICNSSWAIGSEQEKSINSHGMCIVCSEKKKKEYIAAEKINISCDYVTDATVHIIPDKSSRAWENAKIISNKPEE